MKFKFFDTFEKAFGEMRSEMNQYFSSTTTEINEMISEVKNAEAENNDGSVIKETVVEETKPDGTKTVTRTILRSSAPSPKK